MSTSSERILGLSGSYHGGPRKLFNSTATRELERAHGALATGSTLMQKAGLAVAQFAIAVAPHAKIFWIICGTGNNAGDGFEAAFHLKTLGKVPVVTCLCKDWTYPTDAELSRQKALQSGVTFSDPGPDLWDICIDALFGLGLRRELGTRCLDWIQRINQSPAPVIAVDVPTGLDVDSGSVGQGYVHADFTLTLLTLKPGLFTGVGRDACGEIWFNDLGIVTPSGASATLSGNTISRHRLHASHKGNYGDVCVIGGQSGMLGALHLAGRAAVHAGAGRVFVCPLRPEASAMFDAIQPELMFRVIQSMELDKMTVVAGCGGGMAISEHLENILIHSRQLVLDADGINAVAASAGLRTLLAQRACSATILTPHPLEAARLLETSTACIQANRLVAAQEIADTFNCIAVLKGSGTIIATPRERPHINPTGNASLATGGTGDVLAGLIGAYMARGDEPLEAAIEAVFKHGAIASNWIQPTHLTAHALVELLSI